jgi:hypothetical protein
MTGLSFAMSTKCLSAECLSAKRRGTAAQTRPTLKSTISASFLEMETGVDFPEEFPESLAAAATCRKRYKTFLFCDQGCFK